MASGAINLTAISLENRNIIIGMTDAHPTALDISENEAELQSFQIPTPDPDQKPGPDGKYRVFNVSLSWNSLEGVYLVRDILAKVYDRDKDTAPGQAVKST